MKGAFELALVMIFGMFFLAISLSIVAVMINYHNARFIQEQIIATIEHNHSVDSPVLDLIEQLSLCNGCHYQLEKREDLRVEVSVYFPIFVPLIQFQSMASVTGITIPIP